jgi:hypothetical protein
MAMAAMVDTVSWHFFAGEGSSNSVLKCIRPKAIRILQVSLHIQLIKCMMEF